MHSCLSMPIKPSESATPPVPGGPPSTGSHRPQIDLFKGLLQALRRPSKPSGRAGLGPLTATPHASRLLAHQLKTSRGEGLAQASARAGDRRERGAKLEALHHQRAIGLDELDSRREEAGALRSRPDPKAAEATSRHPSGSENLNGSFASLPTEPSGSTGSDPGTAPRSNDRALQAIALVDSIRALIRSGRPALELSLQGPWTGRVSIEKTGPSAVSVSFEATDKRPSPDELAALRRAVADVGLSLSFLRMG